MLPPLRIIETRRLDAAASEVIMHIPERWRQWGRHLVLTINGRSDAAVVSSTVSLQFNFYGGAVYNNEQFAAAGGAPSSARADNQVALDQFLITGASAPASAFGGGWAIFPNAFGLFDKASGGLTGSAENLLRLITGRHVNLNPIHTVRFFLGAGNFIAGTTFILAVADEDKRIGEVVLDAAGAISFTGIPSDVDGLGDLVLVASLRSDAAAAQDVVNIEVNADAAVGNYERQHVRAQDAVISAQQFNDNILGTTVGNTVAANIFGVVLATISQYAKPSDDLHVTALTGFHQPGTPRARVWYGSLRRNNIVALNRVDLTQGTGANWIAGSMASLYFAPRRRLIQRQVLTIDTASVTFTVPSTVEDAVIRGLELNAYTRTGEAVAVADIDLNFNGDDTPGNYDVQRLTGGGGGVAAAQSAGDETIGVTPGASAAANVFAGGGIWIPLPLATDRHKHILGASGNPDAQVRLASMRWEDLAAIGSLEVNSVGEFFKAGTVIELWAEVEENTRNASFLERL